MSFFNPLVLSYLAFAVLAAETAVLVALLRRRRAALALSIALNGISGLCLIAALLTVLHGGGLAVFAVWLTAALIAHLADLIRRLPQQNDG